MRAATDLRAMAAYRRCGFRCATAALYFSIHASSAARAAGPTSIRSLCWCRVSTLINRKGCRALATGLNISTAPSTGPIWVTNSKFIRECFSWISGILSKPPVSETVCNAPRHWRPSGSRRTAGGASVSCARGLRNARSAICNWGILDECGIASKNVEDHERAR